MQIQIHPWAIQGQQFGGPEVLEKKAFVSRPLSSGQIRLRLSNIGINRADILLRKGQYHSRQLPFIPGFEATGLVIESGMPDDFPVGARVLTFDRGSGLYATEAVVDSIYCCIIPEGVDDQIACALPVNWLTAYYCLHHLLKAKAEETILINAAGSGVGLAAIQLAKLLNLKIIASSGSSHKLKLIQELGAHWIIDFQKEDLLNKVKKFTQGYGVNVALDIIGGPAFGPMLKCLAPFARLVALANITTEDSIMNTRDFYPKNATLMGFQLGALIGSGQWDPRPTLDHLLNLANEKKITPIIDSIFSLEDASIAQQFLESGKAFGKILLTNNH